MTSTGSGAGTAAGSGPAGTESASARGDTALVLAIDAGNSKTDVAVVAADGRVAGAARGGGFRPPAVGVETAVDALAEAVGRAFAEAGVGSAAHVSACLANADLPIEEEQLAAALHARAWGTSVEVRNDTFAILRAGIAEPRGVAVVCGAGINCVGMRPDGRTARFPAIGRISGDWGGGWGMAEEALWHAARAEDGRGGPTALARTLPAHFGLDSMYALIEALHLERIGNAQRHELTPVLFATAVAGDPVARSLVDRLAEEVVAMATVALTRLDLLDEETPVLLGGSILAARHPQLDDRIGELLTARAPKAVPRVVTASPVLGAALLGLDHVQAPAEVHARVRAQYEQRQGRRPTSSLMTGDDLRAATGATWPAADEKSLSYAVPGIGARSPRPSSCRSASPRWTAAGPGGVHRRRPGAGSCRAAAVGRAARGTAESAAAHRPAVNRPVTEGNRTDPDRVFMGRGVVRGASRCAAVPNGPPERTGWAAIRTRSRQGLCGCQSRRRYLRPCTSVRVPRARGGGDRRMTMGEVK